MVRWLNHLQNQGLAVRAMVLGVTILAEYAVVAPVAAHLDGVMALVAAAVGGTLCLTGATTALIVSHLLRGPQFALHALLAGMALRMAIPLGVGVALHLRGGPLADARLLYYLLVFYPVGLIVETALSLPASRQLSSSRQGPSSGAS
jgi:hypothetical protein